MRFSLFALLLSSWSFGNLYAQQDSTLTPAPPLSFGAYLESYYLFDFSNPDNHKRPSFIYAYNRHNEITINLGVLHATYQSARIRAKLALMAGTYSNINLAAEPGVLRNIFEAYAGIRLSKTKQLWLDAGIFSSHIGFESAIGADCWAMTRSLAAENSPYYSAGAQLTYTSDNEQWLLRAVLINGWQRIYRVNGNQMPAFGHQITWTPNKMWTLNSSSFIGSNMPNTVRVMRYFHHFYAQWAPSSSFGLIAGFDVGGQQQAPKRSALNWWYTPLVVARYAPNKVLAVAARAEYFSDPNHVVIETGTQMGFQTLGFSLNVDVRLFKRALWRIEGRWFHSLGDRIFADAGGSGSVDNFAVGTALSVKF